VSRRTVALLIGALLLIIILLLVLLLLRLGSGPSDQEVTREVTREETTQQAPQKDQEKKDQEKKDQEKKDQEKKDQEKKDQRRRTRKRRKQQRDSYRTGAQHLCALWPSEFPRKPLLAATIRRADITLNTQRTSYSPGRIDLYDRGYGKFTTTPSLSS
jgi:hypothetical protein